MRLRNILILLAILLALGGYVYFSHIPKPTPPEKERVRVWLVNVDDLQRIEIRLPREGKSQTFIKETKETDNETSESWHFDDPQRSAINPERWGGGIPLLLSGPGADRVIAENAPEEKLAEFGLTQPRMTVTLTLKDGSSVNITIGDATPNGNNFYAQVPGTNNVCTVDYSWYGVVERLVKDPPYASASSD